MLRGITLSKEMLTNRLHVDAALDNVYVMERKTRVVMNSRKSWTEKRAEIMSRPGAGAAYEATRIRYELGRAVRMRREALGLTQSQLADLAGLKQPAVARFEAGGTMPTIPMLERLAEALEMRVSVELHPLSEAC